MQAMTPSLLLSAFVHIVLLPPMSLFVLIVAGLLLRRRFPRSARALRLGGLIALLVLSTNAGSRLLVMPLEAMTTPLLKAKDSGAQAIVILAAGSLQMAPEYDGRDVPDRIALGRIRYGARLQHQTELPLLVTGGNGTPDGRVEPKALGMERALREDFRTPVAWTETASETTAENATFSAAILKRNKIGRILLVTDAMHMARARGAFERSGLQVVEAPTMFYGRGKVQWLDFLPSAAALHRSYYASYEWMGLVWYRLKH